VVLAGMLAFVWKSADFRGNRDNILGGAVRRARGGGRMVVDWRTLGQSWKEFANFNMNALPLRVQTQSYSTSAAGRCRSLPVRSANFSLLTFGMAGMAGVIAARSSGR
jgi:hypothetical protein